ncbi:MAG TPA: bifunctional 2-C-methyl-D-erythritol 4-phosphate cytidylyltransferase/2-C-methyl-D-erythritol 2,4-cyclodiphosphate synthase [Patescibacteria group bacterium]|nr:bifunctional 2-C-methyl-D-erythritol 4-phosphate cytidylyltransferase/2-C-methyl-D-erythritol 2,4-cyclodiphosphate synthase [Patescibacteria group bacterium]
MTIKPPKIIALILAAGSGERFGAALPKQYQPLLGRPMLTWSVDMFSQHPEINSVYVAVHPDHKHLFELAAPGIAAVNGGTTRQQSVLNGLEEIAKKDKPDYVLIHDAARPGISSNLITSVCNALKNYEAVIPGLPVTDTIKRVREGQLTTENRDNLFTVQTAQGFHFDTILELHRRHADKSLTDDAALCEIAGPAIEIVPGEKDNFKVTHAVDLAAMEQAISARLGDVRTGSGYDVHKLVEQPGRKLLICGVDIPHSHALEGHSDADVGLHAITDALLGAIGAGDIGMHFSPKDERWKNADSAGFLRHAARLVAERGGAISHVDVTIICESPKIGPHRDAMRARLGELLSLPPDRVSVKATTTESLGFTGRREGIAAEAVATVRLPFTAAPVSPQDDLRKWGK